MDKIFFSKDISKLLEFKLGSNFGKDTIVIYHAMYDKPDVTAGQIIEWEKYKVVYSNLEPSRIVLIGINRMITPSNRCDFIHAYLAVMTPQISKIIIDTSPFIGEPWRLYFHYQIVNSFSKFGANYSYPIEGEWLRWFGRDIPECKFSPENLKDYIVDTYSDLPKLTTTFEFYIPEKVDMEWYDEAKKFEFEKFRSAKMMLINLLKVANKRFSIGINYESYLTNGTFKVPDIGIYRFIVEENKRRLGIYNLFSKSEIGKGKVVLH